MTLLSSVQNKIRKIFSGPQKSFSIYWRGYGGWSALFRSFYFWTTLILALLITIVNCNRPNEECWNWTNSVISILPSILGFSLGGYAFLVGFGNEKFMEILRSKETSDEVSIYMTVNSTFLHFIIVQFISLFYTVLFIAFNLKNIILNYIGIFLFLYSLVTIVSTAFCVLNLADWFDTMKAPDNNEDI